MPTWIPRSILGAVLALTYMVLAIFAVAADRAPGGGGGWISLRGMLSFLVTFPVSAIGELIGMKPDFRRNLDMAFAISTCAILIYFVSAGLGKLTRLIIDAAAGS